MRQHVGPDRVVSRFVASLARFMLVVQKGRTHRKTKIKFHQIHHQLQCQLHIVTVLICINECFQLWSSFSSSLCILRCSAGPRTSLQLVLRPLPASSDRGVYGSPTSSGAPNGGIPKLLNGLNTHFSRLDLWQDFFLASRVYKPTDIQVCFSLQRKWFRKLFRIQMLTIEFEVPDVFLQITEIFVGFEDMSVLFLS